MSNKMVSERERERLMVEEAEKLLLPCPFCSGNGQLRLSGSYDYELGSYSYYAECADCRVNYREKSQAPVEKAVAMWNKRSQNESKWQRTIAQESEGNFHEQN